MPICARDPATSHVSLLHSKTQADSLVGPTFRCRSAGTRHDPGPCLPASPAASPPPTARHDSYQRCCLGGGELATRRRELAGSAAATIPALLLRGLAVVVLTGRLPCGAGSVAGVALLGLSLVGEGGAERLRWYQK